MADYVADASSTGVTALGATTFWSSATCPGPTVAKGPKLPLPEPGLLDRSSFDRPLAWTPCIWNPWPEAVAAPMMMPMSGELGPADRPQLEELVNRARTELRKWGEAADRDPGVALLQLFAFVGDLLSSSSGRFAAAAHAGVARQQDVEVEVDGHPWQQVRDLAGSGAQDPHFVVSQVDGGASVIEFGDEVRGRRPPSSSTIGVRYRRGGAYTSVLLQQGRVIIDTDVGGAPVPGACGVYRARVLDNADPLMQRRLLVRIPDVSGDAPVWAAACLPLPDSSMGPAVGDGVWIAAYRTRPRT